jgi:hypothetical protein
MGCGGRGTSTDETGAEWDGVRSTCAHDTLEVGGDPGVAFRQPFTSAGGDGGKTWGPPLQGLQVWVSCPVVTLRRGQEPDFDRALPRPAVAAAINAAGVRLNGARRSAGGGARR